MDDLAKVITDIFGGEVNASDEKLRAHCLEQLDRCQRVLAELSRPEYQPFVRFALAWRAMERELEEVQRMVNEVSAEKAVDPLAELLAQLVKN